MLRAIAGEIWVVEHALRMGLIDFGVRMTVIRLGDGTLLLYSAVAIDDALAEQLAELGEVRHIVAPNAFHYLFVAAAKERYERATVYGTKALMRKRPKLPIDEALSDVAPPSWGETVALLVVDGSPRMDEVVLHHRPSSTLVVCDLVFHVHDVKGWFSRLVFRSLGVLGRVMQSLLWRFWLTEDRALAEASLEPIWTWDIERVVLSHGRLIEGPDAKAQLAGGLAWMCAGQARRALSSGDP